MWRELEEETAKRREIDRVELKNMLIRHAQGAVPLEKRIKKSGCDIGMIEKVTKTQDKNVTGKDLRKSLDDMALLRDSKGIIMTKEGLVDKNKPPGTLASPLKISLKQGIFGPESDQRTIEIVEPPERPLQEIDLISDESLDDIKEQSEATENGTSDSEEEEEK